MGSVLSSSSSSSPLPLPPSPPPEIKYDVFLSFRGEDTRSNFTSHLHKALLDNQIDTFIDYKLNRGAEIFPSLLKAIEESQIAIIIFSKDYASSRWCLEELVKILECKKNHGQIVLPVFYEIDPSDVRNQTGAFEVAFASHGRRFKDNLVKVQEWKRALEYAANLSGHDSRVVKPESVLVETIVEDVLERLNNMPPNDDNKKLVGIESIIIEIETLLGVGDQIYKDVRKVGIWGIGGIGKTTLAKAVFDKIFCQFQGSHFVGNVREASEKKDLKSLRRELYSAILGDENAYTCNFTKKRLRRTKLLIVLDDVSSFLQVEYLIGGLDCLGSGSQIIVTSRDQQVLKNIGVDYIYKVEELSFHDALKLFCQHAFKQNRPKIEYKELSKGVVEMVGCVPLALKVLGSSLLDKSKEVWESSMKKLESFVDMDIHEVLKISYDGLDCYQQRIFLDIACFYKGWDVNIVMAIMKASYLFTEKDISVLIDKSLIFISRNILLMHDLLEAMGKEIVQQEPVDDPGKRSRLWHHDEINDILTKATGTGKIEGISLNMSKSRDIDLNPYAFTKMQKLKLLNFYCSYDDEKNKVHLHGLDSVLTELRSFHWHGCPLKSLQSHFHLKNIVILEMKNSNVEELWSGVQQVAHLKRIDFRGSRNLISIPDLSLAPNLESLNVAHCENLTTIPDCSGYKSLKDLILVYCPNLKRLPEIPSTLEGFYFSGCKSEIELPSSFNHLNRKKYFDSLSGCENLTSIPDLRGWESLLELTIKSCLKLKMLPEMPNSIKALHLTNILTEELPISFEDLCRLRYLHLTNCPRLKSLPSSVSKLKSLEYLMLRNCPKIGELPNDIRTLENLVQITAEGNAIREVPDSNCWSTTLVCLRLNGNNFERLPESITNLSNSELDVSNCERLKILPTLPWARIIAVNCTSLKEISCPSSRNDVFAQNSSLFCKDFFPRAWEKDLIFSVNLGKCYKLDRNSLDKFLKDILWNIRSLADEGYSIDNYHTVYHGVKLRISICYPESKIPKWFNYQKEGSSIDVSLPKKLFNHNFFCFAVCIVLACPDHQLDPGEDKFDVSYKCTKKSKKRDHKLVEKLVMFNGFLPKPKSQNDRSNHVIFGIGSHILTEACHNKFSFQFYAKSRQFGPSTKWCKVEKCGVHLIFNKHNKISGESEKVDEPHIEESDEEDEPHSKRLKHF